MVAFSPALREVSIPGPVGMLEAISSSPVIATDDVLSNTVVIICHPHPLFGGTMHNKVVTTLYKTFDAMGFYTIRFNYRGVGKSDGCYGEMLGEIADLQAVLAWLRQHRPACTVWLAGFSFGGYISASVANQDEQIAQLVTVAPAVNHANFLSLTDICCPWLIVHGEDDEVVPFAEGAAFAAQSVVPVTFINMPATGHFCHGKLLDLRNVLTVALASSNCK